MTMMMKRRRLQYKNAHNIRTTVEYGKRKKIVINLLK